MVKELCTSMNLDSKESLATLPNNKFELKLEIRTPSCSVKNLKGASKVYSGV